MTLGAAFILLDDAEVALVRARDGVGEMLRDAIADAGLSRREVARALGVSHVTVVEWCHGQRPIPGARHEALLALLGGGS